MLSLFQQFPQYWMQGFFESVAGFQRGAREPFPTHEDPPPTTPYTVIHEAGKARLRCYAADPRRYRTPLLIVYALIKRPFILDLLPGRSLVQTLLNQGFAVYLLDWIPPTRADHWRGFDAYVNEDLAQAVRAVQRHAGAAQTVLFGYCFGGLLTTIYAALHQATVHSLITLNLPLDLSVRQVPLFTFLMDQFSPDTVELVNATYGNCPAWLINAGFTAMAPIHHSVDKYVNLHRNHGKEEYRNMFRLVERWMNSDVPLAGQIFREVVVDIFQRSRLVRNQFRLRGELVDLRRITCPVLNVVGEQDDVVHPASSLALTELVGSRDAQTLRFPTGHIGAVVSSLAHQRLWPQVGAWLRERLAPA
jgi:polyhydroxyalkanoate synthase